jgi:hypothetical protein
MSRSCTAFLAAALLSASTPVAAYQISAQTQLSLGGAGEGSTTAEQVSAVDYRVEPDTGNIIDMSAFVSGASGVLNGRSRIDIGDVSGAGIYNFPAEWTALLRESLVLDAASLTPVVVRGSLQVVTNSSVVFYPFSEQGYARQTVRLKIRYGDSANPSASDIQANGFTRQQNPADLWTDSSGASPPESATAVGSIETGSVDLELHILVTPGKKLWVEAQVDGEADAGLNAGSYVESGLETQLTLDVVGSTYTATFPFFLAPEPDSALLGGVALATLALSSLRRTR